MIKLLHGWYMKVDTYNFTLFKLRKNETGKNVGKYVEVDHRYYGTLKSLLRGYLTEIERVAVAKSKNDLKDVLANVEKGHKQFLNSWNDLTKEANDLIDKQSK